MTTVNPISPIRVSPNGRHFVDAGGRPVFWLGDTLWELFRLYTPEEALRLLKNRQAKGINVILAMLFGVDSAKAGGAGGTTPYANLEGQPLWIDNDPLRPNEKYFQHIDRSIRLGERTGQTLVVGVYHQWQADTITVQNARAWARWVAQRYCDVPNLIWSMYPKAEPAFAPVCGELAAGLREGDGGAHLISMHPDPAVCSSSFLHEEPWLAFNMIQTCTAYDKIHETVSADYARTPTKPVVMAEGGYEGLQYGRSHTPHSIRKQAYWSQLSGAYFVYGHNDNWAAPRNWEQWMDAPGAAQLPIFRSVITSLREWWLLVPDPSLLASGAGSGFARNLAARAAAGDWLVAYLSEPSTVSLRLDAITAGRRGKATWIDPRSGERKPAGSFAAAGAQSFTTPQGWEDAVLLVDAE